MDLKLFMQNKKPPMSMYRLAKNSGVSYSHIRDIVRGDSEPTWPIIKKLAAALDVNVAELMGDKQNTEPPTPAA